MFEQLAIVSFFQYERVKEFNSESNIVGSSITQQLTLMNFSVEPFNRIRIELTRKITGKELVQSGWLLHKQVLFDFDMYWKATFDERKELLLQITKGEMLLLAGQFNWAKETINSCFTRVLEAGIKSEGQWAKEVDVDVDTKAGILFYFEKDYIKIHLILSDRANFAESQYELLKIWPHDMYLYRLLGELDYRDHCIILTSEDKKFEIHFNLITEKKEVFGMLPRWLHIETNE